MSQAIFYLLKTPHKVSAIEQIATIACQLTLKHYQQKQRIYIHCQEQQQAFDIDETLWQFEPDSFVPHNLIGEGPEYGSPVEIGYGKQAPSSASMKNRHLLINLADQSPHFAVNFANIIDFVASDETLKVIARERYKQYRAMGIELTTQELAPST